MVSNGKSDNALRTIGEVAETLDVATHVLRFWESKFHQIKPQKRRGRRYYRPEDVNIIIKIKELLYEKGYTIRGVQKYLLEEAKNKVADKAESEDSVSSPATASTAVSSAPLNPALFGKPSAVSVPQGDFTSFKTDIFGNIVPANAVPVAGVGNQKVVQPNPQTVAVDDKYSSEDVQKLEDIYSGLLEARKRLKDVA
ncbi:MAG: MerR family transcriptional regulator [Rickettsiales bacterium]|nr:MerR family transcriptional regulator [Pseudomonadota bacterium]MDA0966925.1 MerR family transcriptional regulator [Pseudomonadota bacterium]MDG4543844.1 MerR family transcriptional regulator [Rickettsiales bacterium]MDG4545990.1 MerR family transcriptional regulator [Rickettsiales bacterium]MDG4548236.1 MerR family transcriptional regulator [Rickettsiales bacterium]